MCILQAAYSVVGNMVEDMKVPFTPYVGCIEMRRLLLMCTTVPNVLSTNYITSE